jgi:Transposase IS66 family
MFFRLTMTTVPSRIPANHEFGWKRKRPVLDATAAIEKVVLASPVMCSDETSVRVTGKNWWEWVFVATIAVLHVIKPSRCKAVVSARFGEIRPEVWVSACWAASAATASCGRSAWRICRAMRNMPSTPVTGRSARRSGSCYCVRSRSGNGEKRCGTRP